MKKTVFIGTGNIAGAHAEALAQVNGASLAAFVDPAPGRAESFAATHGAAATYTDIDSALAAGGFDIAHVLTPPATHFAIARQLLEAGIGVFLEKPMAEQAGEAQELCALAAERGVPLRVNQNYVHNPAHLRMKSGLAAGQIGRVRHVSCRYVMPLRQLAARQFGHWMFDSPRNLLLEQVIHPLSLIDDVLGPVRLTAVTAGPAETYADGISLTTSWICAFEGEGGTAQLHVSLGATWHDWSMDVLGDDGRIAVDYLANTAVLSRPGGYIDFLETMRGGLAEGVDQVGQRVGGGVSYLAAQAKLIGRSDPFYLSIRNSVRAFYEDVAGGGAELDGARGARLVALCNDIAGKGSPDAAPRARAARRENFQPDVVLLGGTGFIGSYLTRDLVGAGKKVRVVARNTGNPARVFTHDQVELVRGSITDRALLDEVLAGVPVVVNLAHGGGGDTWEAVRSSMVGGAEKVADAVLAAGAKKFLHVSSIAALYVGDPDAVITSQTPVDPQAEERADYARAKAEAEQMLLEKCEEHGLPLSLWRPGVVVGEGTSPFHSGVGLYNRERICLGWNDGTNLLPFVLAEDVAGAMASAILDLPPATLTGKAFNLVGDVRLSAREYTTLLAGQTGRPLIYRPQFLWQQQAGEVAKWVIKRAGGRKVAFPSMRDLRSRGLVSRFDTTAEKEILNWQPVSDRKTFIDRAIAVHAR